MHPCPSFSNFFEALWDCGPFPWQAMLAERIAAGRWPRAVDLPTAAGKTACIDAAIYTLAYQADRPIAERTAPRRIWFVVDRRIVVDEAFERASIIAERLAAAQRGPLKTIADRLLDIGGTKRPLAVARLRGGMLRDDNWGRLPSQPAVITSTVDQFGSRLLFRGYGRSNLTASIYAGLAAHDSLVLLDEAHLSMPFLETLCAVEQFRGAGWAEKPISTPFAFAFLSATPPEMPQDEVFPSRHERRAALDHPVLRARMGSSKPAGLVEVKADAKGDDALAEKAVEQAWSYVEKENKERVAVIVNRVKTAREICARLCAKAGAKASIVLLTGRIRPYERDRLVEKWKSFLRAASPEQPQKPIIFVSTQCIEVGADFSFDALVTEIASLDALRQRFGRLNRMGTPGVAPATILVRENDAKEGQSDPIYGAAIPECWRMLTGKAAEAFDGKKSIQSIDFGIDLLDRTLSQIDREDLHKCLAPRPKAPILLPAYLDLLCQTAPASAIEPDIRLFLHGKERGAPEVRILWRADFSMDNQQVWSEIAALCPPVSGEMLTMPIHRVRAWLTEEVSVDIETSDVEGAGVASISAVHGETNGRGKVIRPVLVWRGRDRSSIVRRDWAIKPNDVIIAPAAYGMPDAGQSAPAQTLGAEQLDLWEPAQGTSGRPFAMRINRAVLQPWLGHPPLKELVSIAEDPATEREEISSAIEAVCRFTPVADDAAPTLPLWLLDLFDKVRNGSVEEHPDGGCVLFAKGGATIGSAEPDLFADDDDLLSAVGQEATLTLHTASVEIAVEKIARQCLSDEFIDPLRSAALWHDVGKLDERFQLLLRNGDEVANCLGEPLAKSASVPISPARRKAIRAAAGLPRGFRHEMLSLQLAQSHPAPPASELAMDLALHLIASHHGHARPFAPVVTDLDPPAISGCHERTAIALSTAERTSSVMPHHLGSGISDRFWRLTRRYGWWGLAYLEAILRLADWYGSEHVTEKRLAAGTEPVVFQGKTDNTAATTGVDEPLVLTGIDGANPLGFLASVGALLVLRQGVCPKARLGWKCAATWQPVLFGVSSVDKNVVSESIIKILRNRFDDAAQTSVVDAWMHLKKAECALEAKEMEIDKKTRGSNSRKRGKEESRKELEPLKKQREMLKEKRDERLYEWASAVRPEVAIRDLTKCTESEYREYAAQFPRDHADVAHASLDFLAAFASDACLEYDKKEKKWRIDVTPFCFARGSGHQYFLDTVRRLMREGTVDRVKSTLFEPWTYSDKGLSLRWDPREAARYALMDVNPGPLGAYTVWMANLLAYRALALFPSAPGASGFETTGWTAGEFFTWPIWECPADPDTIRSLMLLEDLGATNPDRSALRARGLVTAYRSQRIRVGSGANYKINFGPARGI